MTEEMTVISIGKVKSKEDKIIEIYPEYRDAMKYMDEFSHLIILWMISENRDEESRSVLRSTPPIDNSPEMGVFASRSPYRPNPIGLTIVKLKEVDFDKGLLYLDHMDAYTDTPIIDIKPYLTNSEHIPLDEIQLPSWFAELNTPRSVSD